MTAAAAATAVRGRLPPPLDESSQSEKAIGEDQPEQCRCTIDAHLLAEHPHQPDDGGEHRKGHRGPEAGHPGAGPGQPAGESGPQAGRQVGRGHAGAERGEDAQRLRRRLGECGAERGAHERRGAGRRHRHRQDAGEPVIDDRVPRTHGRERARQDARDLEHAKEIQADQRKQERQAGDEERRLQLEAPAELVARQRETRAAAPARATNDRTTPKV